MVVFNGIEELGSSFKNAVVTLGVFDGLHQAHMKIVDRVVQASKELKTRSLMITFDPHPRNVLAQSGSPVRLLTTRNEKINLLKNTGLDGVLFLNVDQKLLNTDSETFVKTILVDKIQVQKVVIGYDYHFGKDRDGKPEKLQDCGRKYSFEVEIIDPITINGETVRSSLIRSQISEGSIEKAAIFLDRQYSIVANVIHGAGRGRKLGFPTANLDVDMTLKMIPADGIYLTESIIDDKRYFGICNIGVRKTFNEQKRIVEVYLMDINDINLYDYKIEIKFLERLRDEIKFATSAELIDRMKQDEIECRERIKKYKV